MAPEKKVAALYKRTMTRSENRGLSPKDAKKKAEAMAAALKAKLGI
jgi:hypothetical protein